MCRKVDVSNFLKTLNEVCDTHFSAVRGVALVGLLMGVGLGLAGLCWWTAMMDGCVSWVDRATPPIRPISQWCDKNWHAQVGFVDFKEPFFQFIIACHYFTKLF